MDENETPLEPEKNDADQTANEIDPVNEEPVQSDAPEKEQPAQELAPEKPAEEPAQPAPKPQSPPYDVVAAEKEAYLSVGSGVWMLISCIVATVGLLNTFLGNILSFQFFNFTPLILDIIITVGLWVTYALCKKKKLSATGIQLIKIPYIILFVLTVLSFVGDVLGSILAMAIYVSLSNLVVTFFSLLLSIAAFVFKALCFKSVKMTLNMALAINKEQSTVGMKAGKFAAIAMIVAAALTFITTLLAPADSGLSTLEALAELPFIGDIFRNILSLLRGVSAWLALVGRAFSILAAVVVLLANISVAIVLLQFANKMHKVRAEASAAYGAR